MYKRIGLILAVIATATHTWAAARWWLDQPERFTSFQTALWPSIALTLLTAVTALAWMLLERRTYRLAAIFGSWATFTLFWAPSIWYLSALPLFVLFWYEGARRIQDDVADKRRIRVNAVIARGVGFILLGAFLMVSVGYYLLPSSQSTTTSTVSRGIQGSLESAYDNPIVEQQLADLPPGAQAQFRRDAAKYVDDMVTRFLGPFGRFIPPFLAFALFLVLWSLSFIFRELAIWLGVVLFWVLRKTKFALIVPEESSIDVIKL